MSRKNGPSITTNGLVLYLDAANRQSYTSGSTTWTDVSNNANNGTLTNGPTFSSANGGSIVFDGTNDYVSCSNNESLSFTNKLTLQIWCSLNINGQYDSPLMKTTSDAWNDGYGFYMENNRFYFFINSWDGAHRVSVSKTTFPMTNFVGTYDGTCLKLYENGILMQTGSFFNSNVSNSSANLLIGMGGGNNIYAWNGNISQVSIYNISLTASEVLQNYNTTKTRFGL